MNEESRKTSQAFGGQGTTGSSLDKRFNFPFLSCGHLSSQELTDRMTGKDSGKAEDSVSSLNGGVVIKNRQATPGNGHQI